METIEAERCVIVLDEELPPGRLANAAAVLALTLGARMPHLLGADLVDADGDVHPGMYPRGLPVLRAPGDRLPALRSRARELGVEVIDFAAAGQTTTDYEEFTGIVAKTAAGDLTYVGLLFAGPAKAVNRVTGSLPLLR